MHTGRAQQVPNEKIAVAAHESNKKNTGRSHEHNKKNKRNTGIAQTTQQQKWEDEMVHDRGNVISGENNSGDEEGREEEMHTYIHT